MTAAQNSIALKGSRSFGNMIAVVALGLILAIVLVAISARSLAAPATTVSGHTTPLTLGHDESRFTAPVLTSGHDEARPSSVQYLPGTYIPYQAHRLHPAVPRVGGLYVHSQSQLPTVPQDTRHGGK